MYYTTHTRFNSWLVGMVTGYLLFKLQKRKEPLRMTRVSISSTATLKTDSGADNIKPTNYLMLFWRPGEQTVAFVNYFWTTNRIVLLLPITV